MQHDTAHQAPIAHTPPAVAHGNDDDSDAVSAASLPIDDMRALRSFNDQERARANQRRDVLDKAVKFQPGQTYLHDFISATSGLLKTKHFLDEKEKAQLLVQMLDKAVMDKLKGDSRIVNPNTMD